MSAPRWLAAPRWRIELYDHLRREWLPCLVDWLPATFSTYAEAEAEARYSFCMTEPYRVLLVTDEVICRTCGAVYFGEPRSGEFTCEDCGGTKT